VARPVTVDGVGDEYSGAHDAEEHGDSFQHDNTPKRAGGQIRLHAAYTRLIPSDAGVSKLARRFDATCPGSIAIGLHQPAVATFHRCLRMSVSDFLQYRR